MTEDNKLLRNADLIQKTMKTKGWSEIIYPLLKDMIFEITGGERNGVFIEGKINNKTPRNELSGLIGYKDGLIDFWNNLVSVIVMAEKYKAKLEKAKNKNEN